MDYRSPNLEKATRSRIKHLDRAWQGRQAGKEGREGGVLQVAEAGAMEMANGGEVDKSRWKKGGREGGREGGKEGGREGGRDKEISVL